MDLKHTTLEEDEKYDLQLIKEGLQKEKNMLKFAQWLSEKFSYRYGPDFSGRVDVKFNIVDKVFKVNCSDGSSFVLDQDRLLEMPGYIRVMRLKARRGKKADKHQS
ncbi:hypothetical protein J4206_03480 [Candidatus Woesearchaeota archaeon]|nr:hypothetical protein [Candidatus Woesearchaeota archaeon]